MAFLQPQLLRWLLSYVSTYQSTRENEKYGGPEPPSAMQGFMIAGIMFVAAITQTVILHQVIHLPVQLANLFFRLINILLVFPKVF